MTKKNKRKVALGLGVGLAVAAAAGGAGYYFFGAKHAAKHRKNAAGWAKKVHADVLKKANKLKKVDRSKYYAIVDQALRAYKSAQGIDKRDLAAASRELKSSWGAIQRELVRAERAQKKAVVRAAKNVRGTARRVVAKVPRKLLKKKKA